MDRSQMIVASVGFAAFALLTGLESKAVDRAWQPEEARSAMFLGRQDVRSARPARPLAVATLARWDAPRRDVVDVAGRTFLPGTRQPLGARRSLATTGRSSATSDEPLSAMGPNGPVCSVVNPNPTGPPTICSTVNTGCPEPEPDAPEPDAFLVGAP